MFKRYSHGIINPDDIFNQEKRRTVRNTPYVYYNCAGYALNTFNWYNLSYENLFEIHTVEACAKELLQDMPNLRVISSEKDLFPNEYMIAFRLSQNDFHFIKRAKNGNWYQKCGRSNHIRRISKEKVLNDEWHQPSGGLEVYSGEIIFFAVAN